MKRFETKEVYCYPQKMFFYASKFSRKVLGPISPNWVLSVKMVPWAYSSTFTTPNALIWMKKQYNDPIQTTPTQFWRLLIPKIVYWMRWGKFSSNFSLVYRLALPRIYPFNPIFQRSCYPYRVVLDLFWKIYLLSNFPECLVPNPP